MARRNYLMWLAVVLYFGTAPIEVVPAKDQELKPEELVAKHLKSIGTPEVLEGLKSRAFSGTTSVRFLLGGTGQLNGQSQFVSEGRNLGIDLKYGTLNYRGEHFAFNGKDVSVSYIDHGRRSPLGDFINLHNSLMKEGLIGGALSLGWPLLKVQERQPKMEYRKKSVEGRQLHEIRYRPKKNVGDVEVYLYFDQETFRHVRTEYRLRINAGMAGAPGQAAREQDNPGSIYLLTEQFADFMEVDGMMLPHSYNIDFSVEGRGNTFLAHWTIEAKQWLHNGQIDPQVFEMKQ